MQSQRFFTLVAFLALFLTGFVLSEGTDENSVPQEGGETAQIISIRYEISRHAIWSADATLEEVSQEERTEYIHEALMEISQKMKRKHQVKSLKNYNVVSMEDDLVLVEYPDLQPPDASEGAHWTDDQLKALATKILGTGVVNRINILRDGEEADVFNLAEFQKWAKEQYDEASKNRKITEAEQKLIDERDEKQKRYAEELLQKQQARLDENERLQQDSVETIEKMEQSHEALEAKVAKIEKLMSDLQQKQAAIQVKRAAYEKEHGITDGDERMAKALEKAREKAKAQSLEREQDQAAEEVPPGSSDQSRELTQGEAQQEVESQPEPLKKDEEKQAETEL